jgi:hypothetical protein
VVVHSFNANSTLTAVMGSEGSVNVTSGAKFEFSQIGTDSHYVSDLNVGSAELVFGYLDVREIVLVLVGLSKGKITIFCMMPGLEVRMTRKAQKLRKCAMKTM